MKKGVTWVVLGAVGLIAALAVADALRPSPVEQRPAVPTERSARPATLRETLRAEAVTGFVLYSDRDCRLHSLLLPRMVDDVIRDEGGSDVFRCRFDVEHGRLVGERPSRAPKSGQVPLTGRELRAIARVHPLVSRLERNWPIRVRVAAVARLAPRWMALSLSVKPLSIEKQYLFVLLEDKAVVTLAVGARGPYKSLVVSPHGSLVAAADGTILTRTGGSLDPPQNLPTGRAVAFSPDEHWLVWVNGSSTYLMATPLNGEPDRIIRLPIPARDLVWQPVTSGTSVGPPRNR